MTPTKALEIIRAAVIAANPEIIQLGFGCRIEFANKAPDNPATILMMNYAGNYLVQVYRSTATIRSKQIRNIYGRPIRLADVVWMMLSRYSTSSREFIKLIDLWNMGNDDLNHASDECKLFIASLLQSK